MALLGFAIIPQPPARFAHPFHGPVSVTEMPYDALNRACGAGVVVFACGSVGGRRCVIWIRQGLEPELRAQVLAHEIGHCNGWSARHES